MIMRAFVVATALALAACSPPAVSTASSGKPGAAAAPQTSAPAVQAQPQQVADSGKPGGGAPANLITPQFLYGRWGDNGDCTKDIVFNPDGTFTAYTGGSGQWQINGDNVVMSGANGTFTLQMQWIDQNHLLLRNPDGSVGTSQRC